MKKAKPLFSRASHCHYGDARIIMLHIKNSKMLRTSCFITPKDGLSLRICQLKAMYISVHVLHGLGSRMIMTGSSQCSPTPYRSRFEEEKNQAFLQIFLNY